LREREVLLKLYYDQHEHIAKAPEEATTLLSVGETPRERPAPPARRRGGAGRFVSADD
jgi:hypothetical protein